MEDANSGAANEEEVDRKLKAEEIKATIALIKAFGCQNKLPEGMSIREMIEEGRM